ncbi:MAG: NmrA family NAD(P)-binding protein [Cyanobacteria bacterium P01_A01_bin.37]
MTTQPNILVLGATGKVGAEVVRILAEFDDVNVIAGVRSLEKAQHLKDQSIEIRHIDLDRQETLAPALNGVTRALLLTGYTVDMLKQSKAFLDTAKQARVEHIVHIGASGAPTNEVAHWGWHQFIEKYIEASGFRYTHLRPEAFMQNITGPGYRWLEGNRILNYAGNDPWSWLDCNDLALVAATTLHDAETYAGQTIRLGYDGKTFEEIAQMLTDVLGTPFYAEDRSPEEFLDNALQTGADSAYMTCIYNQFKLNGEGKIPNAGATFENFETITGRKPMTWRDFIVKHREELITG